MERRNDRPALGAVVTLRFDQDTNRRLIKAKNRSGRSKSCEVRLRIKDHLDRFPDFYCSEASKKEENV